MWFDFMIAALSAIVFLFLPGGLFVYSARRSLIEAFGFAPILGLVFYSLAAVFYFFAGITASWSSLFLPYFVVSLIASGFLFCKKWHKKPKNVTKDELLYILFYVTAGIVVAGFFFVKNLDGAGSFFQAYDNGSHLSTVRTFVDTGIYSSLNTWSVVDSVSPFDESGLSFYPSALYCLVAMVITATGANITVAMNAVLFVCISLVFPLSILFAARIVFCADKKSLFVGALLALCAAPFPWGFLTFGPLYPNLLSMAVFPAAAACSIRLVSFDTAKRTRVLAFFAALIAAVALLFAQPNSIFAELVILAPFFVSECILKAWGRDGRLTPFVVASIAGSVAFAVIAWGVLYNLPFSMIRNVVDFNWPSTTGKWQAIVDCLLYSFNTGAAQPLVALFVAVGSMKALSSRKTVWLFAAYVFACLIYISSVSSEGYLKHFLSGFWYTDPYRLAATAAVVSLPLIVLGAKWIFDWCKSLVVGNKENVKLHLNIKVCAGALALMFVVLIYGPSFSISGCGSVNTGFGNIADKIERQNNSSLDNVLSSDEKRFTEKALQIVPESAVIINEPNDGSGFLYALYDAKNVLYRCFALPSGGEKLESMEIRQHLVDIATNQEVKAAVDDFGAEYVLLLDRGGNPEARVHFWSYYPEQWEGITRITDETPGFEVVLAEGDMRLYRIAA